MSNATKDLEVAFKAKAYLKPDELRMRTHDNGNTVHDMWKARYGADDDAKDTR
jgi:hypothetical protein